VYYSLRGVTYFNDFRRFPRLIDGFNAIFSPFSRFFFVRYRSPIVPGTVILMSLVNTFLVIGHMFAFTIETPDLVGAFHPVVRLFPNFTTTCSMLIMVFDTVSCPASRTLDVIQSARLRPMVPLPALLTLRNEFSQWQPLRETNENV
jgi:hypothetical protein